MYKVTRAKIMPVAPEVNSQEAAKVARIAAASVATSAIYEAAVATRAAAEAAAAAETHEATAKAAADQLIDMAIQLFRDAISIRVG